MYVKNLLGISVCAAFAASSGSAWSEPTLDHLLSVVNVNGSLKCGSIDIRLNRPVSYTGNFPQSTGTDLTIHLEPLATTLPSEGSVSLKEAASVAPGNVANLGAVIFDPVSTTGPVIHLVFSKPMAFHVLLDNDNRHLRVAVSPPDNALKCLGKATSFDEPAPNSEGAKPDAPKTDQATKSDETAKPDAAAPANDAAGALKEGKRALAGGDYARATAYFTKAVSIGSGAEKQDAQEMLGLSRERAGQMAFARAEYETYLKLYSTGAGSARVKDRLNGVLAAMENKANEEFAKRQAVRLAANPAAPTTNPLGKGNQLTALPLPVVPGRPNTLANLLVTQQGIRANLRETPIDPKAWTWEKHGSLAQYYYRDDNFVPSIAGANNLDAHKVYQNEVLSTGDFYIRGENEDYSLEASISAYNEKGIGEQYATNSSNLSTVYVDGRLKGPKIGAKLGRQSRSTGGVFGRFDGLTLAWEPIANLKTHSVLGSPVYSANAQPFADGRYFYGASIEYTLPSKEWSGGLYAIEQDVQNIVDRRALGGELRYVGKNLSVYSAADYDIFYGELNNAYVSGTWNPREGTSIYATADYRKVPFLLTSNALTGENFGQLSTLVDLVGQDTTSQLASARTASSETLTVGASQQISKDWQLSLDATVANYSGTPPSGTPILGMQQGFAAPGLEYYLSAQASGLSLFKENDSVSFGLRYSQSQTNHMYMADASYRYPFNDKLRLGPRIRVSLLDAQLSRGEQFVYSIVPSFKSSYRINKQWSLEAEISANWKDVVAPLSATQSMDLLATAGYRFEF
jgi:hypothetical protein